MKYMSFNNSCFFTAVACLLEDYDIDVTDAEIVKESLVPYLFECNYKENSYYCGYQIQSSDVLNEYLKRYILKFKEFIPNSGAIEEQKRTLVMKLKSDELKKIVSLKIGSNGVNHAVIYTGYNDNVYTLESMQRENDNIEPLLLSEEELVELLNDDVRYGFIERDTDFSVINQREKVEQSLLVLKQYQEELVEYCDQSMTYEKRVECRDRLFRGLLLNYVDISKIIGELDLHNKLLELQKAYIDSFRDREELRLFDKMDANLLNEVFNNIEKLLEKNVDRDYYHGSKTKGISKLVPETSIHNEKYVYLTTNKIISLIYTVNAIESYYEKTGLENLEKFHPWYSYGFNKGKLQIDEYYPNALKETYKNRSGVIYKCLPPQEVSNPTNIYCAYVTKEEVKVNEEIIIDDIYVTLLEYESKGIIDIKRYSEWSEEDKKKIEERVIDSFNQFELVNKPKYNYTIFLKAKFPHLFE